MATVSSKYGAGIYGISKYGEKEVSRTYYAANLNGWCYTFNTVSLIWTSIATDPTDPAPTHWKLVRSFTGLPDNPFEATGLTGDEWSSFRTTYIDQNIANDNLQVNYSIWLFNGEDWILCGQKDIVIVQETNTLTKVLKWLPRAWLNPIDATGEVLGEPEQDNDLVNTLRAYTFMYDKFDAEIDILQSVSAQNSHSALLPNQMSELGFTYEPALGDSYHRALYKAGNVINGSKGTAGAIDAYVTGLTHLGNYIEIGHNLMLDYNDSSFEESIGRWYTSKGTFVSCTYANSLSVLGTAITPPDLPLADALFPPRGAGFGVLTIPEDFVPTLSMRLPSVTVSPLLYGTPVKEKTRYLFSGWVRHLTSSATVSVTIYWYNSIGEGIGNNTSSTPITTTTTWKEFTSKSDAGRNGQLSPANAAYAVISFSVTSSVTTTSKLLFDMFQLAQADVSLEFEDARRVRVYLQGETENFLPNPSFEQGIGGWTVSPNASYAQDPTVYNNALISGTCLGEITIQTPGPAWVASDWFVVQPGLNYTFSAHLGTHYPNFGRVQLRIEFSNRESVELQVKTFEDENGSYYSNDYYYVESDIVTLSAHYVLDENGNPIVDAFEPGQPIQYIPDIARLHVTGIAPQYTRDSGEPMAKVSIHWLDTNQRSETCYMDALLFQPSNSLTPYFDGSGAPTPENPVTDYFFKDADCFWEYKNIANFITNPSFSSTTGWATESGSTLTSDTAGMAATRAVEPNGTLSNTTILPEPYGPYVGTTMGKVSYNINVGGGISTTVYLPSPAVGGEDFVVSAFVRAAEALYTISTSGGGVTTSTTMEVYQHDQYQWIRIVAVRQLLPGETSFTMSVHATPPPPFFPGGPAGYTIGPTNFFHIDAAQAEYGRIPTGYVGPDSVGSHTIPNTGNLATNMHVAQTQSIGGGKSSYIPNYGVKLSRLTNSLGLVMPHGSTWCVKPGFPTENYPDLTESLISNASFEKSLGGWTGNNSILNRVVSRGSLFGDFVTHGAAYCKVISSGTNSSTKAFGIHTDQFKVYAGRGYYSSIALRPDNSNSTSGTYKLRVDYYTEGDSQIKVYYGITDVATSTYAFSVSTSSFEGAYSEVTDTYRQKVVSITRTDRWAFVNLIMPAFSTVGASYAVLTVTYTPATFVAGQAFHIDRAIFRE
jgi:hypothetical protein